MYFTRDGVERDELMAVYPRHRAYLDEFAKAGEIQYIGAFLNPGTVASMAIFTSEDAAQRFMADDPFVTEGLVGRREIREWDPLEY
jgi:uncharacterized protein YciI